MFLTKRFLILFILLSYIIAVEGCSLKNVIILDPVNTENNNQLNIQGNTSNNISNGGLVSKQGDHIYYATNEGLYKMDAHGINVVKLDSSKARHINVVGDWIYYGNFSRQGNIYKIGIDGKNKTKLNNELSSFLYVVLDWIFYATEDGIFKMSAHSLETTQLTSGPVISMIVSGEWVYYGNFSDNGKIYRVRIDGSDKQKINDLYSINLNIMGEWLYFIAASDEYNLYKMRIDGTNLIKMFNHANQLHECVNVTEDWIYFYDAFDGGILYRTKHDGTQEHAIYYGQVFNINICNDSIYFNSDYNGKNGLTRLPLEVRQWDGP